MLKREQYVFSVRRPYPPLFLGMIWHGMAVADYYRGLVNKPCPILHTLEVAGDVYYDKTDLARARSVVWAEWQDPKIMNRAWKTFDKNEAELLATTKKDFKAFRAAYEKYSPAILLPWQAEEPVAQRMRKLLEKKCSAAKVEELMSALNIPLQDNIHKQEERDLVLTRSVQQHVKKYEWFKSRFGAIAPYTVAEAKAKLEAINKKEFLAAYHKEKKYIRAAIKEAKKLLGKEWHLVDFMQFIVYYRTHRTDTLNRAQYLFVPELKNMAKARRLTYKQLLYCTHDEIVENSIPPLAELNARIKSHALVMEAGQVQCLSGKAADKVRVFLHEKVGNTSEVRGAIAFTGKARGSARLIFGTDDFSKVKAGDIIVTSMTNPHMIPIMKKAAAFVTDEGGITCHAAILAREMKKPCIIGTKIATKVFKDGDRIEVDADKGIVRKI